MCRWIGEKYDGIRFCWHPGNQSLYHSFIIIIFINTTKQFFYFIGYSRTGVVLLPDLLSNFSNLFMDGEIWYNNKTN